MPSVCVPRLDPDVNTRPRPPCVPPNSIGVLATRGADVRVASSTFAGGPRNGTGPCVFLEACGSEELLDKGATIYTDVSADSDRVATSTCFRGTGRILPLQAGARHGWPTLATTRLERLRRVRRTWTVIVRVHARRLARPSMRRGHPHIHRCPLLQACGPLRRGAALCSAVLQ